MQIIKTELEHTYQHYVSARRPVPRRRFAILQMLFAEIKMRYERAIESDAGRAVRLIRS